MFPIVIRNLWLLHKTPLMYAAKNGHTEVVKFLIVQKGIDVYAINFSSLCLKLI